VVGNAIISHGTQDISRRINQYYPWCEMLSHKAFFGHINNITDLGGSNPRGSQKLLTLRSQIANLEELMGKMNFSKLQFDYSMWVFFGTHEGLIPDVCDIIYITKKIPCVIAFHTMDNIGLFSWYFVTHLSLARPEWNTLTNISEPQVLHLQ